MAETVGYRICGICEAACGLALDLDGRTVLRIRGNDDDVFSTGHLCAKGIALSELDADPDRLRRPLLRDGDRLREASWEEAWAVINARLNCVREQDSDAIATYFGNPTAHNIGLARSMGTFAGLLGSKNLFSAASVDQLPKQLASELMFGNDMAIPVPDILHCDYLLMLGANPLVSNGSLWVVPKVRDKIRALQQRGGHLTVVDPRRTETARAADSHYGIRPGGDAWLLAALFQRLRAQGYAPPAGLAVRGLRALDHALADITQAQVIAHSGLSAAQIDRLLTDLMRAECPVVYGRVGTTLQAFGTLTSFLVEALNLLLGALDRRGGAMFPDQPMYDVPSAPGPLKYNRWQSRVSGYPEVLGQMPVVALAEEIETPGDGQIRALVCIAGNPVVSTPDSARLTSALEALDFLVCIDLYHNETTRLADVVLPGTSPFEDSHYDSFLGAMGYRNAARYSPALFDPAQPDEWTMGLTFAYCLQAGRVPDAEALQQFEDDLVAGAVSAYVQDPGSGIHGRDLQDIMGRIGPARGVERLLDLGIRAGRWGDHFGRRDGLTLKVMADEPNGIDLGEISEGRLAELVRHADGQLALAPPTIVREIQRLAAQSPAAGLTLIGRRTTRSNNSWLRNLPALGRGSSLCTLQMHPDDAQRRSLSDGAQVRVRSATGEVTATVAITDALAVGVVSLPHGFSPASDLRQGQLTPGPNYNELAATTAVDAPSGTAALNGVPVEVLGLPAGLPAG